MLRTLRFEMTRGIKSKGLYVSIGIGILLVLLDFFTFRFMPKGMRDMQYPVSVIETWLGTDYKFAYNNLFYVLMPILAALPFAASYYDDISSGYIKNICVKASRRDYYVSKYISVFVYAAFAVGVSLLASLMLCMSFYPNLKPEKLIYYTSTIMDAGFMSELFNLQPLIYIILYILIDCVFAGIIAVFSICIAEFVQSRFSALVVPFAVYILSGTVTGQLGGNWSMLDLANPIQLVCAHAREIWLIICLGIVISVLWIALKGKRRDIL